MHWGWWIASRPRGRPGQWDQRFESGLLWRRIITKSPCRGGDFPFGLPPPRISEPLGLLRFHGSQNGNAQPCVKPPGSSRDRSVYRRYGLYNVALGGLFALTFALAYGRMGDLTRELQRLCLRSRPSRGLYRSESQIPGKSAGDKPDVTLTGERTIGIEVTRFYLQPGSSPESKQRQRPLRNAVGRTGAGTLSSPRR
jgi:hypothetical protein